MAKFVKIYDYQAGEARVESGDRAEGQISEVLRVKLAALRNGHQ